MTSAPAFERRGAIAGTISKSSDKAQGIFEKLNGGRADRGEDKKKVLPTIVVRDGSASDPARSIFDQLSRGLAGSVEEAEELPTTVVFRSSMNSSGSSRGEQRGVSSGKAKRSSVPKPPRSRESALGARSPRTTRSLQAREDGAEEAIRGAICHEFSRGPRKPPRGACEGKRGGRGSAGKKVQEGNPTAHEELALKLREAGLHGEASTVRQRAKGTTKTRPEEQIESEEEERDDSGEEEREEATPPPHDQEEEATSSRWSQGGTAKNAANPLETKLAGLHHLLPPTNPDRAPSSSPSPQTGPDSTEALSPASKALTEEEKARRRDERQREREEEEVRIADLLSPVPCASSGLSERASTSYKRLKEKMNTALGRLEGLRNDSIKVSAGLDHVEDEYGFWESRCDALEKGKSASLGDGPDWDELYTEVCTPELNTPSKNIAPKEHIEVEVSQEPFEAQFALGGGPGEKPISVLQSDEAPNTKGRKFKGALKK